MFIKVQNGRVALSKEKIRNALMCDYSKHIKNAYLLKQGISLLGDRTHTPGPIEKEVRQQRLAWRSENKVFSILHELDEKSTFGFGFCEFSYCGPHFFEYTLDEYGIYHQMICRNVKALLPVLYDFIGLGFSIGEVADACWIYALNNDLFKIDETLSFVDKLNDMPLDVLADEFPLDDFYAIIELVNVRMEQQFIDLFGEIIVKAYKNKSCLERRAKAYADWCAKEDALFKLFEEFQAKYLRIYKVLKGEDEYFGVVTNREDKDNGSRDPFTGAYSGNRYTDYLPYDTAEKVYGYPFSKTDLICRQQLWLDIETEIEEGNIKIDKASGFVYWDSPEDYRVYMKGLILRMLKEIDEHVHSRYYLNEIITRIWIRLNIVPLQNCYSGYDFHRPNWFHGLGNDNVDAHFGVLSTIKKRADSLVNNSHVKNWLSGGKRS